MSNNTNKKINKIKCEFCLKKQIIWIQCSYCNKFYCMKHRIPELHNCENNSQDISNKDSLNKQAIICEKVIKI